MPSRRRSKRCSTPTVAPLHSAGRPAVPTVIVAGPNAGYRPGTCDAPQGAWIGPPRGHPPAGFGGPAATVVARQGKWRNGRRARFRSVCPKGRGGSTPPLPTSSWGIPQGLETETGRAAPGRGCRSSPYVVADAAQRSPVGDLPAAATAPNEQPGTGASMPSGLDARHRAATRVAAIRSPYPGVDALAPTPDGAGDSVGRDAAGEQLAPVVHLADR